MSCSDTSSSSVPISETVRGNSSCPSELESLEITLPRPLPAKSGTTEPTSLESEQPTSGLDFAQAVPVEQMQMNIVGDLRKCTQCGRVLPVECFTLHRPGNSPESYRNRRCNPCRARRQSGSDLARRKKAMVEAAKSRPCADCGKQWPLIAMDFDHVRGVKKYTIGTAWRWAPEDALLEEIAKCDVVCACCHRVRHADDSNKGGKKGRPPKFLASSGLEVGGGITSRTSWGAVRVRV